MPCVQIFRFWNRRRCLKFRTRSTIPNSISRSAMRWLRDLWVLSRSILRSPRTIGSRPLNLYSASSTSRRCSRVDGGRYAPTSGVRVGTVTICSLPCLARGSVWVQYPTRCSIPLSPYLHRLGISWLCIGATPSTSHSTPGGCGSMPLSGSLSLSEASSQISHVPSPGYPVLIRSPRHPGCLVSW